MTPALHPALGLVAAGHAVLALGCALALLVPAEPLMGVHPALKPFKFGVSIAILLASLAWLVPRLGASAVTRERLAWLMVWTMVVEMAVIALQAARGTTSHFNLGTPLDAALWHVMQAAIVLATVGMAVLAWVASSAPLEGIGGALQFAWRAGLWVSLLGAVSGFRMGAGLAHSVGGPDGGPGLWVFNWSRTLGDLRVSHFISLHALQVLPLVAWTATALRLEALQWPAVLAATAVTVALSVGTLVQALLGRPWW